MAELRIIKKVIELTLLFPPCPRGYITIICLHKSAGWVGGKFV